MTTIGHALTGISVGLLCLPKRRRSKASLALALAGFAVLANVPDLPAPGWGHHLYHVSHSVFVNGALIAGCALALGWRAELRRRLGGWRVAAGGGVAWLSHLVLDSTYNHGQGIAIFWPLSWARLNLALPWFSTLRPWWALDLHTLRVAATEILAYGLLLLACLAVRRWALRPSSE